MADNLEEIAQRILADQVPQAVLIGDEEISLERPDLGVTLDDRAARILAGSRAFTEIEDPRERLGKAQRRASRQDQRIAAEVEQERLGVEELTFMERADLGFQDVLKEQQKSFTDRFPDGFLDEIEGELIFRKSENEPFSRVDKDIVAKFEPMGDLADLSGDIPEIIGEIIAVVATGGQSLLGRMVAAGAGAFAGEAAQQALQGVLGTQSDEPFDFLVTRPAIAAAQGFIGESFGGVIDLLSGIRSSAVLPGGRGAQISAKRLGIPKVRGAQISANPLVRKLTSQSAQLTTSIDNYIRSQSKGLVTALRSMTPKGRKKLIQGDLQSLARELNQQMDVFIEKVVGKKGNLSLREGGLALQEGVAKWDTAMRAVVDRSYADARAIETPQFDYRPLVAEAQSLRRGTLAVRRALEAEPQGRVIDVNPPSRELSALIDDVLAIDPSKTAKITAPDGSIVEVPQTEVLRALQQRARDMAIPPVGQAPGRLTTDQAKAATLSRTIGDVLKNPENADKAFQKAWKQANDLAASRFSRQENLIVREAAKTETPEQLAKRFTTPGSASQVGILREIVADKQFNDVRIAVANDMLSDLSTFPKKWDALSREPGQDTLLALFTPEQIRGMDTLAARTKDLNRLNLDGILEKQGSAASLVDGLVNRKDTAGIDILFRETASRPEVRESIRAGMLEDIINKATVTKEGEPLSVNPKIINAMLRQWNESGALKFLKFKDVRKLKDTEAVRNVVRLSSDVGTSMVAAGVVGGIRSDPLGAGQQILSAIGIGRLLMSPIGDRLFVPGRKLAPSFSFADLSAGLTQIVSDLERAELSNGQ